MAKSRVYFGTSHPPSYRGLAMVASMCGIRDVLKLRRTLGKIALIASHRIYLARNSSDWSSGELVKP